MVVDPRFFVPLGPLTLAQIVAVTGAEVRGSTDRVIDGIAAAADARTSDVCFHEGRAQQAAGVSAAAGACFVTREAADHLPGSVTALISATPRADHVRIAQTLFRHRSWSDEGAPAQVHPTAKIAPGAFLGAGVVIGARTEIGPNASIGPGVQIGYDCAIGANVSIQCALIGNGVKIFSGARIGESGFGVMGDKGAAVDIPQWGRVIIQDAVTIGANSCIDRGAFADTIIGENTKIDNLCQIAHNVVIGRNVMLASYAGISGTSVLEDGVMAGGRVGIADHVRIGAGAKLAADAGIFRDIPAGEVWGGSPARPIRQYLREIAWLQKQTSPKKTPS